MTSASDDEQYGNIYRSPLDLAGEIVRPEGHEVPDDSDNPDSDLPETPGPR